MEQSPSFKANRFSASQEILRSHAVAQLLETLRYKSEGRGFDSR